MQQSYRNLASVHLGHIAIAMLKVDTVVDHFAGYRHCGFAAFRLDVSGDRSALLQLSFTTIELSHISVKHGNNRRKTEFALATVLRGVPWQLYLLIVTSLRQRRSGLCFAAPQPFESRCTLQRLCSGGLCIPGIHHCGSAAVSCCPHRLILKLMSRHTTAVKHLRTSPAAV